MPSGKHREIDELRRKAALYLASLEALDEGACLYERLPIRPDGLRDYRYIWMNSAMQGMFGIADLSGQSIRDNFPDEVEAWYDDYDRVFDTGEPIRIVRESEPQGMVIEMSVTRVEAVGTAVLLAVMRNVTARVRAEEALQQEEARKAILLEVSDATRALNDPASIQNVATRLLAEHFGVDGCLYAEFALEDGEEIVLISHEFRAPQVRSLVGRYPASQFGSEASRLQAGQPVAVDDVETEDASDGGKAVWRALGCVRDSEFRWSRTVTWSLCWAFTAPSQSTGRTRTYRW